MVVPSLIRLGAPLAALIAVTAGRDSRASAENAAPSLVLDGQVPAGPDHFLVPFTVPAGTKEIEIVHDDRSETNILDFGLEDANGYRGWGGGTAEHIVIGEHAASRAYVPGPIGAGEWKVVIGKAKIVYPPGSYHIEIFFRTEPTLPPATVRQPYRPATLGKQSRYYAGDFHVHSKESTDATPALDEMASFAESRHLDFIAVTDHNTVTQMDFFADAQSRHPRLLLIPGIEFTTYAGHANAIGATSWVDHKLGQPGVTIQGAADAILGQGALLSVNHPMLDLGDRCIGCAWKHDLDPSSISAVEVATGGLSQGGILFTPLAISFWDSLCSKGHHIAAIGGSDSHSAGDPSGANASPIGDPTTLVYAEELSTAGILAGIKNGRTVVKLQGPSDPMIELTSEVPPRGDTIFARSTILRAKVTGGIDSVVHFVKDGEDQRDVTVTSDPFVYEAHVPAPQTGEERWRVEVLIGDRRRTLTSHLYIRRDPAGPDPVGAAGQDAGGCVTIGRAASSWPSVALASGFASALGLLARRRKRK